MKVVKFGGTSLANAQSIEIAKNIVSSDSGRSFVVVSAPGKCKEFGRKITDLLIDAHAELADSGYTDNGHGGHNLQPATADSGSESLDLVLRRFRDLSAQLGIDMETEIARTHEEILINKKHYDFVVSRGEYLMARLFAAYVGFKFIDAANYVVIKRSGKVNEVATRAKFQRCIKQGEKIVMGGFYGQSIDGGVKTFSRGGSDYSGAIAAVCMGAEVYENFTDTYGVQSANPVIVKNTKNISKLDFGLMHKLSVAGASVIHPDCLPLLRKHAMPLKVDNTFDAGRFSTWVSASRNNAKYFCITYETRHNINKDTVEIMCAYNNLVLHLSELRRILKHIEVYLVKFERRAFTLLSPVENLSEVVNLLHEYLNTL